MHATHVDNHGHLVENEQLIIDIAGPETATLSSALSGPAGIAEATRKTSARNRRRDAGTGIGSYTAAGADVTAAGFNWDGVRASTGSSLQ